LADITSVFTKFEYMGLDFTPKIAICLTHHSIGKYNKEDEETTFESIISYLKLMKIPTCGVDITFFKTKRDIIKGIKHNFRNMQELWGFKEEWNGSGNFIAVGKIRGKEHLSKIDLSFVKEYAKERNLDIIEIGYGQTIEEQHRILRDCKFLVSQRGSITYFSAMMNTPLVLITNDGPFYNPMPMNNGNLGGIVFQNTVIGLDVDISKFSNGMLQIKPYDRFVMTKPHCKNNTELLDKMIDSPNNIPEHFKYIVRNNRDIFFDQIDTFRQSIKEIIDG